MSAQIDVLAVMDRLEDYYRRHEVLIGPVDDAYSVEHKVARLAVAELIETAKEFSDLYGYLWDVVAPDGAGFLSPESVKKYDDAHGKLMAALANVGGTK